jgi:serine protease Do
LNRLLLIASLLAAFPLCAAGEDAAEAARIALRRTPIVTAVEKVQGCVVNISTERMLVTRGGLGPFATGDAVFDRFFQDFFSGPTVEQRKVNAPLGSGCVITSSGLVITNEHVVRRASNVKLSLNTGETFDAVVLAADPAADLALLRAQTAKPLKAIPMGVSSDLMLGEPVVAVGNPFGFESSVTSGIISAMNREITVGEGDDAVHYTGLIQTSALINPGNSGGPLVNVLGELIGINSAIVDGAQGIGFAIPIDRARDVLAPLLAAPQVSEAWAGVRGATVPGRRGARVTQLEAGGPAEKVLRADDVIVSLDGRPVGDLFDFFMQLVQRQPGDAVALRVERGGRALDVQLTLGRRPQPSPGELLERKFGLTGSDLTPALARERGTVVDFGVYAAEVSPGGPAERAGLERGDVIIQIGSSQVRNLREAAAALGATIAGERVIVVIVRQDYRAYTRVTVGE